MSAFYSDTEGEQVPGHPKTFVLPSISYRIYARPMKGSNVAKEATLAIATLGGLALRIEQQRLEHTVPAKSAAILVYLADHGGRVRRTKLAGLLWSDHTEERARSNLRITLSRLRRGLGGRVASDRDALWLEGSFSYDAHLLSSASPEQLLALYGGDFLSGFAAPGAELFDEWLVGRRAVLHATGIERISEEARRARDASNWSLCRQLAERLVEFEAWHEQGHRWLIESIAATTEPTAAIAHYERFARSLEEEVGTEPEPATKQLVAAIRDRPRPPPRLEPRDLAAARPPTWPTAFLGRSSELDRLRQLARFRSPVSIVGPGGIGKSRLLAAFAKEREASGAQVIYTTFDGHESTSKEATFRVFAETILASLRVPSDSEAGPEDTLRRYLSQGRWTLCLDNVEQLEDVERPISDLATRCPELEIILTTRRRLVLVSGRVLELQGLAYDDHGDTLSPAVALFLDRLPRSPDTAAEMEIVRSVCSTVAGHPLAIELAAHWAASASLGELAAVVETNHALATTAHDLPTRHRALDVLVAASVERVPPEAQRVLRAATVFSGPFSRRDIEALVIVSDKELAQLVQHSLLTLHSERYHLHPVIRRFTTTLFDSPDALDELSARHARRMIEVMTRDDDAGHDSTIQTRADDLRRAISWCIANIDVETLMPPLRRYLGYLRAWGWFKAGLATIELALQRDDLGPVLSAELHRYAAEAMLHAGKIDEATRTLERGLACVGSRIPNGSARRRVWNAQQAAVLSVSPLGRASAEKEQRAAERARLMSLLGEVFYVSERRAEMISYSLGSLAAGRRSREPVLIASGDAAISVAAQLSGAHGVSERYRKRARDRLKDAASQDPFTATMAWGVTALVAAGAGQWADARKDCAASIGAARASGRARIVSQTEILLALVDCHEGKAKNALARLHDIEREIERNGFRRGLTWVYATRAEAAYRIHDFALARGAAQDALRTANEHGRPEDASRAHIMLARLDLKSDALETARAHLRDALPGLAADSALAIQHLESHCGAASVAIAVERRTGPSTPSAREMVAKLRSYARAYPIAGPRYADLRTLHDRRPDRR
jgi:DNA-binding SARP family transcriptional activator/tetratricopeptide (TPR) repeat protein